jgi:hypothetical protein
MGIILKSDEVKRKEKTLTYEEHNALKILIAIR